MPGKVPQPEWREAVTANLSTRTKPVRWIILHHTAGRRGGDLPILLGQTKRKVSADFYIERDGVVFKLNPQLSAKFTWHAGLSYFKGVWNLNRVTVGIEMEHVPREGWPDGQVENCAQLCAWLVDRFKLNIDDGPIQSHRAIAFPRGRKRDPEAFPWSEFSALVRGYLGLTPL